MIATLQAICYLVIFELLSPPETKQIRFITRECVSKILLPTRDKDGYPISGLDVVHKVENETFFLVKNEKCVIVTRDLM